MKRNYDNRLDKFVTEMMQDPIKINNDKIANEFTDPDYKFYRNKMLAEDEMAKTRNSVDFAKTNTTHMFNGT